MTGITDGIYPLFPLEIVLYPNMPLPLHIFEPRYQQLVADCLENHREFGVILMRNGKMSTVGTLAKIENVMERLPDGRMNILTLGKKRFSLVKFLGLVEDKAYFQAQVKILEDIPEDATLLEKFRKQGEDLLNEFAHLTGIQSQSELFTNFTAGTFSFLLSELNGFTLFQQQKILELPSVSLRYEEVLVSLEAFVKKTALIKHIKDSLGDSADVENILN